MKFEGLILVFFVCILAVKSQRGGELVENKFNSNNLVSSSFGKRDTVSSDQKSECRIVAYDKVRGFLNWPQVFFSFKQPV